MKAINIVTLAPTTRRNARIQQTLAALIAQVALHLKVGAPASVMDYLSSVTSLAPGSDVELEELVEVKMEYGEITLRLIDENRKLTLGDLLCAGTTNRLAESTALGGILIQREISIPTSVFRRLLCRWPDLTPFHKTLLLALYAEHSDTPCWHVSANFNEDRELMVELDRLMDVPLGRRIRKGVTQLGALGATAVNLEKSKEGRLHLHGICLTDQPKSDVLDAAHTISGMRTYRKGRQFASKVQLCYFTPGAVLYNFKELGGLMPEDSTTAYLSRQATRLARAHQMNLRQALGEAIGDASWHLGRPEFEDGDEVWAITPLYPPISSGAPARPKTTQHLRLLERISALRLSLMTKPRTPLPALRFARTA